MAEALKQLSERNRETLLMYYFLEMNNEEIAKKQNISRSGVFQNRHNSWLGTYEKITKGETVKMKQTFKKPSYYLLSQAMDGDGKATQKILAFYDPYISKCCLRPTL